MWIKSTWPIKVMVTLQSVKSTVKCFGKRPKMYFEFQIYFILDVAIGCCHGLIYSPVLNTPASKEIVSSHPHNPISCGWNTFGVICLRFDFQIFSNLIYSPQISIKFHLPPLGIDSMLIIELITVLHKKVGI